MKSEKWIKHLMKKFPIIFTAIFCFIFGFAMATVMFNLGVNLPPAPATDYITQFISKNPIIIWVGLFVTMIVMVLFTIDLVKSWVSGYLNLRRFWRRKKRIDNIRRYR